MELRMPFRRYSSYFPLDELDAFTAAYEAAWQHFQATRNTTPDQADVLKKNLTQIILASACKGEREVEKLKAIALRALG
jgi:hypothetical protein